MTGRTVARTAGHVRRRDTTVRRRSAGLTAVRAGAALAMIAAAAAVYGLATSPVFGLDRVSTGGATLTDDAVLQAAIGVPTGTNLVTLDTSELVARLEAIPTVRDAHVTVALPGSLQVQLTERRPILAWAVGERRFLVDVDGRLIAELSSDAAIPALAEDGSVAGAEGATGAESLPLLTDRRKGDAGLEVGDRLDAVDLDAARRLGSLRPSDVGTAAASLAVTVDDTNGFVLRPVKGRWSAVFGFYTPTLRSPDIVPGQVRLLRSLLVDRESQVGRVVLASATDGTYVARPSPSPSPVASPSATP
jgi:hypothetical protein